MNAVARTLYVTILAAALWAVAAGLDALSTAEKLVTRSFGAPPGILLGGLAAGGLALVRTVFTELHGWRKAPAGRGLRLRVLFEVLVLASAAYLVWLQPFKRPTFDVTLGHAAAFWGLFLAAADAARRRGFKSRPAAAAEIVLFNLCLIVVLAEGTSRLWGQSFPSSLFDQADSPAARVVKNHKKIELPGTLRFGFPLNSRGYYDTDFTPPEDGRRLVSSVGDSFSYGVVPHYFHFTTVAERHLGDVVVHNYGFPGIGPAEYLYILETEILPQKPDAVVVNLFVGNDLTEALRIQVEDQGLRSWWDRSNLLVYQVPRRLAMLRKEEAAGPERETPVGSADPRPPGRRLTTPEEMIAEYPWLADPSLERPTFSQKAFLGIQTDHAILNFKPGTTDFTPLFEALDEIRRKVSGMPLVVVVIPDELQVEDAVWRRVERWASKHEFDRNLPQKQIVPWLEERGIVHLDLLPLLRQHCAPDHRGTRHCYHFRDTHFNARGNRLAGEAIAGLLGRVLGPDGNAPRDGGRAHAPALPGSSAGWDYADARGRGGGR